MFLVPVDDASIVVVDLRDEPTDCLPDTDTLGVAATSMLRDELAGQDDGRLWLDLETAQTLTGASAVTTWAWRLGRHPSGVAPLIWHLRDQDRQGEGIQLSPLRPPAVAPVTAGTTLACTESEVARELAQTELVRAERLVVPCAHTRAHMQGGISVDAGALPASAGLKGHGAWTTGGCGVRYALGASGQVVRVGANAPGWMQRLGPTVGLSVPVGGTAGRRRDARLSVSGGVSARRVRTLTGQVVAPRRTASDLPDWGVVDASVGLSICGRPESAGPLGPHRCAPSWRRWTTGITTAAFGGIGGTSRDSEWWEPLFHVEVGIIGLSEAGRGLR